MATVVAVEWVDAVLTSSDSASGAPLPLNAQWVDASLHLSEAQGGATYPTGALPTFVYL